MRNTQNRTIQEFQPDVESQLIQVLMMKMHTIQFVSMMMVIQRKLNRAKTDYGKLEL
jgi:hypothetical protein